MGGMADNGWNWLEWAGNCWKLLAITGIDGNGLKWLEMAGMAGNSWKWLLILALGPKYDLI